jgi:hypothetical protein
MYNVRTISSVTPGLVSAVASDSFTSEIENLLVIETRVQRGTYTRTDTHIERDKRVAWLVISLVCYVLGPRLVGSRSCTVDPGSCTQPMSFLSTADCTIASCCLTYYFLSENLLFLLRNTKWVWASLSPACGRALNVKRTTVPHVPTAGNV